jgi:predicted RNA-binding Zn ribbon-like protein
MRDRTGLEFQFGGRLSLDLTWTVRFRAVAPTELLAEPSALRRWFEAVRLPSPGRPTIGDLDTARALREAIHRAATAVVEGGRIDAADRSLLNHSAAAPPPFPVLTADGARRWDTSSGDEVAAALSVVARDAIELFASAGDGRLRRCSGPQCSLLFHDDSRPGARRWCTTARCGNRVNTKAYRARLSDRHRDTA